MLGPENYDVLHEAAGIAGVVRGAGLLMLSNALLICVAGIVVRSLRQPHAAPLLR